MRKFEINFTAQFKKDIKLLKRQGRDMEKLLAVIDMLAGDEQLAPSLRDHQLTGTYASFRECHVAPDWLLIYRKNAEQLILILSRTGSHSDLF